MAEHLETLVKARKEQSMAETKNQEELTLHAKRKPDLLCEDDELNPKKIQTLGSDTSPVAEENGENEEDCEKESQKFNNSSVSEAKIHQAATELASESEDEDDGDEEDEVDYEDEDDEDGEKSNGVAMADHKGKGISREDKGKGKLIEEEDDSDSDSDDDDDLSQSEGESDLSEDPLAEVDLDNILPSRTRRRTANPGFYIASDLRNVQDDRSDDSNV